MKKIVIISMVALVLLCSGCDDKLDVQQAYDFLLSTMPVQTKIKLWETVEIRCQLNRKGMYEDAKYYIGYFQTEGKGILQKPNGEVLAPNDFYELDNETFRLYYTSFCNVQQVIDITLHDNFDQEYKFSLSFTNNTEGTGSRSVISTVQKSGSIFR